MDGLIVLALVAASFIAAAIYCVANPVYYPYPLPRDHAHLRAIERQMRLEWARILTRLLVQSFSTQARMFHELAVAATRATDATLRFSEALAEADRKAHVAIAEALVKERGADDD